MCGKDADCLNAPFTTCAQLNINPQYNVMSYDTFLYSLIQSYQSCTLEGWTEIMINLQILFGEYIWIYQMLVVIFGAYIIINLVLAVVTIRFVQAQEKVSFSFRFSTTTRKRKISTTSSTARV